MNRVRGVISEAALLLHENRNGWITHAGTRRNLRGGRFREGNLEQSLANRLFDPAPTPSPWAPAPTKTIDPTKTSFDSLMLTIRRLRGSVMAKVNPKNYIQHVPFNKASFASAYAAEFKNVPKYNVGSIPDLLQMLQMMEHDPHVTDLRRMAYMLATAFIESSSTSKTRKQIKDKRGHTVTRTVKVWRNFSPIEEKGHGRTFKYGKPVKVKPLPDGTVRVTEFDGEQWIVSSNGHVHPMRRFESMGVDPGAKANAGYLGDDGDEKSYYGRGFVQLTWWKNYAATGVLLGRGLDLLLDPDLVDEPTLAYQIISTGMRTGAGFANGHRFSQFFHGSHTDYVHARSMVNGKSGEHEVGAIAERFERVLFASRSKAPEIAAR